MNSRNALARKVSSRTGMTLANATRQMAIPPTSTPIRRITFTNAPDAPKNPHGMTKTKHVSATAKRSSGLTMTTNASATKASDGSPAETHARATRPPAGHLPKDREIMRYVNAARRASL